MMFCPKCGSILVPLKDERNKVKVICGCGYRPKHKKNLILKEKIEKKKKIEVIDKVTETLPVTRIECPKCKNMKAYYWLVQTRATDEAETRFFECAKCRNRWRSYS